MLLIEECLKYYELRRRQMLTTFHLENPKEISRLGELRADVILKT
jgi:hypothetical protein